MSKIVNIQGYALQRHNNELMVEDLDLATRLGYERPRKIRDLIKRMLGNGQLASETVCPSVGQTSAKGGRPATVYWLNEKAALKVITKSETVLSDKITDEIIDVYTAARKGELKPRRQDETTLPFKQAEVITRSTLRLCKMLGTETGMAKAIAVEEVRRVTGLDLQRMIVGAATEEVPMTPTQLGAEIGVDAGQMNLLLIQSGLQVKLGPRVYEPTEKGRQFCIMNLYKSQYSEHTGYRPLWFKRVLDDAELRRCTAKADEIHLADVEPARFGSLEQRIAAKTRRIVPADPGAPF